jgi:hypothetical protein
MSAKRQPTPAPTPTTPKAAKRRPTAGLPPMPEDPVLTRKQEDAIVALLEQPTVQLAAKAAGVSRGALHKWLLDPVFKRKYIEARHESLGHAIAMTGRYAPAAVQVLAKIMTDPKVPYAVQVQAADRILNFGRTAHQAEDAALKEQELEMRYTRQSQDAAGNQTVESLLLRAAQRGLLEKIPPHMREYAAQLTKSMEKKA